MSRKLVLLVFMSFFILTVLVSQTMSSQSLSNKQYLIPKSETILDSKISVSRTLAETVHNLDTGLNYTTIQAAIDAVETLDGHTILVDTGVYYEYVVINKSISLTGQKTSTTIIDGGGTGTAVNIIKSNVNVTGFTMQNSGDRGTGIYLNNTNHCIITGNTVTNNWGGVWISNSSGNTVSGNNITNNILGVFLYPSSNNNTVSGNNITNNGDGVQLDGSSGNTVSGNNITNNDYGVLLIRSSNNNTVSGNNITNNGDGVQLDGSSGNSIYHNNFVDNAGQVIIIGDSVNVWDDGFPSGGNYWSSYNGTDSDHDGIGDTLHVIDANNNDSCPLMGMFHSFNTSLGKHVNVISNSTLESFEYSEANSTIRMYVSYESPLEIITFGFCRACIPHELMNVTGISVIIDDGATAILHPNYTLYDNGTHRWIYFAYQHSTHKIDIIPEFPSLILLPLFMTATLLAAMIHRRKRTQ